MPDIEKPSAIPPGQPIDDTSPTTSRTASIDEKDDPYPLDTSPRGWLAVAGGAISLFVAFGWLTCMGEFQAYYSEHQLQNYTSSTIGWIPSAETYFLFLGVPFFGGLSDRLGPRALLVLGTALHVGGLLGLAQSKNYAEIFLTQGIVSAVGAGAIFVAGTTAVSTWFRARRGLALGLASAGSAVGAIVGTAVIPVLMDNLGFAWTMRIVALTYFVLMVPATILTTSRPRPEGASLPPFRVSQLVPVSPLRSGAVSTLAVAAFFYYFAIYIPSNYIKIEALDRSDSPNAANNLLVILNATGLLGRILPGWLGDRYGHFNTTIALGSANLVLFLGVWIGAPWATGRIAFAALYGIGNGAFVAMMPALIAQTCPDPGRLGLYMGAVYLAVSPSVLLAQPIGGALADAGRGDTRDPYVWPKVFCVLAMTLGIFLFGVTRSLLRRAKTEMQEA
ncbi:MFS general substrate transporter [Poronia punctata]|nr:MFS general substrate transporter [Poronia punctata]